MTAHLSKAEATAILAVKDTGIGMSADFLPHAFDQFAQDKPGQTEPRGMGLGLAKHLVERHDGSITVESEGPGRGTTITVKLPLLGSTPSPGGELGGANLLPGPKVPDKLCSAKVVAVDDDADTRELLRFILEQNSAEAIVAGSGEEALKAIKDFRPNILVCDLAMPQMDGYELLENVRRLEPAVGSLPCIAFTASARNKDRIRSRRAGFQAHLVKPVLTEQLVTTIVKPGETGFRLTRGKTRPRPHSAVGDNLLSANSCFGKTVHHFSKIWWRRLAAPADQPLDSLRVAPYGQVPIGSRSVHMEDVLAPNPVEIGMNLTSTVEQPESGNLRTLFHPRATGCRTRDDLEDAELVNRCRDGDTAAFERLVTKYRRRAYAIVYAMVQNEQDARDLAQEGFVRAWGGIHRFKGRSSFYTWLYRIMRNVAVDYLRKRRICADGESYEQIAAANLIPEAQTAPSAAPLPANELQRKETRQQINDAIAQLPPVHRAVIVMKEFECLQYNEIAEILQCSIGTVMSRIYYARRKLQVLLRDAYESL